jgi:DNA-binding CsgD family transcriptional regulator/predicted negative regulator of RcsB-dependent stress response
LRPIKWISPIELLSDERAFTTAAAGESEVDASEVRLERGVVPILERRSELELLRSSIISAGRGTGDLVVIEGPSGIGKSRLLRETREFAIRSGSLVLWSCGSELEQQFPFGIVRQMMEPHIASLSDGARRAAFRGHAQAAAKLLDPKDGDESAAPSDEFQIVHGLYWLIVNLAEESPLTLFADDLQWADGESLRFLLYLAQRVTDLPVMIIVGTRPIESGYEQDLQGRILVQASTILHPDELSPEAVRELLINLVPELPDDSELVSESWKITRGNPFLLSELANQLRTQPRETLLQEKLRIGVAPEAVGRSVMIRLFGLGRDAVALAKAVAVLGHGAPSEIAYRMAGLGFATSAVDLLQSAQVFARTDELAFYHPIIQAAVYGKMSSSELASAHIQAAKLLHDVHADSDRVAMHILRGEPTDQGWARTTLHNAGRKAMRNGSPSAATTYLRRALSITAPEEKDQAGLLVDLGLAEAAVGQQSSVAHLEQAMKLISEPNERATAMFALGQTLFRYGRASEAQKVFRRGADVFSNTDRETSLRFEAGYMASSSYLVDAPVAAHRRLAQLAKSFSTEDQTPAERLLVLHLCVFRAMSQPKSRDHAELAVKTIGDPLRLWRETSDGMTISHVVLALTWSGAAEEAAAIAEPIIAQARSRGDSLIYAEVSLGRALAMYALGRVGDAMVDAQAAIIGMQRGWNSTVPAPQGVLAYCLVDRDELDEAESILDEAATQLREGATRTLNVWFYMARGRLQLAREEYEAALADFLYVGQLLESNSYNNPGYMLTPWRSAAGLAAASLGRREEAVAYADADIADARSFGLPSTLGAALRVKALVIDDAPNIDLLYESAEVLGESGSMLERARTMLSLGTALRTRGKRERSRELLREALDLAHQAGARAVERKAHDELLLTGARPRRSASWGADSLTPSEQRIAALFSRGHTSRSIAESLYLTLNTVEWHRRNLYRKLSVSSREELLEALSDQGRASESDQDPE